MQMATENTGSAGLTEYGVDHAHAGARILLEDTGALISLPEVCVKLRELLGDPQHTQKQISDTIVYDPALTTRLLRIVNSAYYGMSRQINSVDHAIGILGEQELNNLILVSSIVGTMNSVDTVLNIKSFWQSSVFSAVLACNLAKQKKSEDPQEYFIAGLLLDVGKLLIYYKEPELLQKVRKGIEEKGIEDYVIETEEIGFDHSLVGALMAESWSFPPELVEKIAVHHKSTTEKTSFPHVAMYLAGYLGDHLDLNNPDLQAMDELDIDLGATLGKLEISESDLVSLLDTSYVEYAQAYHAFCED